MQKRTEEKRMLGKRLTRSLLLLCAAGALTIATSCSQATSSSMSGAPRSMARQINRDNQSLAWKYFHPSYAENWHWTTKALYWIGPGH